MASPLKEHQAGMQSSIMSFKLSGTPMRRVGSVFAPKTVGPVPMSRLGESPGKRVLDTPIRPRSAQADRRRMILATPLRERRPVTAEGGGQVSCLRRGEGLLSIKKSVSFDRSETEVIGSIPEAQSPTPEVNMQDTRTVEPLTLRLMTPITEKSGERSSISLGLLDSASTPDLPAILDGTVFYTDVWAQDGSSADRYFVPLLTEMGARVVSEWCPEITHVLFKDGSQKTLQRVAQSGVFCVNVGWAVEYVFH
jgi:twin BRCT domain